MSGDPDPIGFGRGLAIAIAVIAALALGAAAGVIVPTLGGIAGALLVGGSTRALAVEAVERRAAGSAGVVAGAVVLAATLLALPPTPAGTVAVCLTVAVLLVGFDAFTGFDEAALGGTVRALANSGLVVALGFVLAAGIGTGVVALAVRTVVVATVRVTSASSFALLLALQYEALLVAFLLKVATPILDDWVRDAGGAFGALVARLRDLGSALRSVPREYALLLAGQTVVALAFPSSLDGALDLLGTFGQGVRALLASRLLHLPLELLIALLVAVIAAEVVRSGIVYWAGNDPPGTIAYAAGGALACLLIWPVAALAPTRNLLGSYLVADPLGLAAASLGALVFVLAATAISLGVLFFFGTLQVVPQWAPGFALGSALLFAAAVTAGVQGVLAPAVFGAAAAAFVVWDVGSEAVELRGELGPGAATERAEFVGAAASVAVGIGAVAVTAVALYVLGPLSLSVPQWRATLSLSLSLVALLSFVLLVVREAREAAG